MNQYEIRQKAKAQFDRQDAAYKEMMTPFLEATEQAERHLSALEVGTFGDKELKE